MWTVGPFLEKALASARSLHLAGPTAPLGAPPADRSSRTRLRLANPEPGASLSLYRLRVLFCVGWREDRLNIG